MTQSYRFRYAEEIAGGFVLLCILMLVVGIYAAGHAQGWFNKKIVLKAKFEVGRGTYGLQEGAEVRILGTQAGWVGEIVPGEDSGMQTSFILKDKFSKFIRTDSVAKVKKKFEVAGDAFVDITLGHPSQPALKSGDYIPCVQDEELIAAARAMVQDFREATLPMLEQFRSILAHVNDVTGQLQKHEGVAGRLIGDPEWAADMQGIVKDIRRTAAELPLLAARLDAVMTNSESLAISLRQASANLPKVTEQVGGVVENMRAATGGLTGEVANVQAVLLQAESMLRQTQILVEGLQKHWLVRRYIQETGETPMKSPVPSKEERNRP